MTIFFDGVSLDSIANVRIEDVRVSPIEIEDTTRPRAVNAGSGFVRSRKGTRTVTITFGVLDENMVNRQKAIQAIRQWAKDDKEYKLELPGHPERYLMAVCTAKPEPSLRQWWESNLRLVFTCFDNPFWNSMYEKSVACGTQFTVLGDTPPLMRIERTVSGSAASNQSYMRSSVGMTFTRIPVGDMVIDLNRQTAAVGSSSIMQYYTPSSTFLLPITGTQTILGTGTIKYRERWE